MILTVLTALYYIHIHCQHRNCMLYNLLRVNFPAFQVRSWYSSCTLDLMHAKFALQLRNMHDASIHTHQPTKVFIQVFYYSLNFFTAFKNLKKINICFTAASHICINTTKSGI